MKEKHLFLYRLLSGIDEELLEKATKGRTRLYEEKKKAAKGFSPKRIALIASAAVVLLLDQVHFIHHIATFF